MTARPVRRAMASVVAFVVLVGCWWLLLSHNLARGETLFARVTSEEARNTLALGADFLEYRDYYRNFPTSASEITRGNTIVEYYKRPLYGPLSAMLNIVAERALGVRYPTTLFLILASYAALATLLLFMLVRTTGLPVLESVLVTGIGAFSFAWLSVFSLPESYSLSACASVAAALSGTRVPDFATPRATRSVWRHAIISGIAGWVYLPAAGAIFLLAGRIRTRRHWLTILLPAALLAGFLAMAPQALPILGEWKVQLDYASRWASLRNFVDPRLVIEVLVSLAFFGIVSPVRDFLLAAPRADLSGFRQWWTLAGSLLLLGAYLAIAWHLARKRNVSRVAGPLLWLGALFLFHTWYNPHEVLLYMSVPVVPLVHLLALGLSGRPDEKPDTRPRAIRIAAIAAVLLIAIANLGVVIGVHG